MYFEDVKVGDVYKSNLSKVITGTEIDLVAQISGLDHPNFLVPERAQKYYGFKDRVVPGPYIMTCMLGLMLKQGFLADALFSYVGEIKFKRPLFPGDSMTVKCEVTGKKESPKGGGPVIYTWTVYNQDNEEVVVGVNH